MALIRYPVAYLMKQYQINGKVLSLALHIDPSLVSKWRKNKTDITTSSNHFTNFCDYIIDIDTNRTKSILAEVLNIDPLQLEHADSNDKSVLLQRWFFDLDAFAKEKDYDQDDASIYQVSSNNKDRFKQLYNDLKQARQEVDFFYNSNIDLYFTTNNEQEAFFSTLLGLVKKGLQIRFVFVLHRDYDYLGHYSLAFFNHLLELMLEHNFKCYMINEVKSLLPITSFTILDHALLYKFSNHFIDLKNLSFDERIHQYDHVEFMYSLFDSLVKRSSLINRQRESSQGPTMASSLINKGTDPENSYFSSHFLSFTIMSETMLLKVLDYNNINQDLQSKIMNYHQRLNTNFTNNTRFYNNYHMYDFEAIKQASLNESTKLVLLSKFLNHDVVLPRKWYFEFIENTITRLNSIPMYQIGFLRTNEIASYWLKEDKILICWSTELEQSEFVIIDNPTILRIYKHNISNTWNDIPLVNRQKEQVIRKFQKILMMTR